MPAAYITIQSFTGANIRPYLPSLARLRIEILREYPYLCENSIDQEMAYLNHYLECPESIAVIVFNDSSIVGAAMGLPLEKERKELIRPFSDTGSNLEEYFYFSKSVLLHEYRGRGIGHHFFEMREEHVRNLERFRSICFWEVIRPDDHPQKPQDFLSLSNFWRKRGYSMRPELEFSLLWREVSQEEDTPQKMVYWTKDLG